MAAHATHATVQLAGTGAWRARGARLGVGATTRAWRISIAGFAAVSLSGVLALLIGVDSGGNAEEIVTAAASVATGVLGHLAPRPSASETLRPIRGEAF
jgi:hypothetical protein